MIEQKIIECLKEEQNQTLTDYNVLGWNLVSVSVYKDRSFIAVQRDSTIPNYNSLYSLAKEYDHERTAMIERLKFYKPSRINKPTLITGIVFLDIGGESLIAVLIAYLEIHLSGIETPDYIKWMFYIFGGLALLGLIMIVGAAIHKKVCQSIDRKKINSLKMKTREKLDKIIAVARRVRLR